MCLNRLSSQDVRAIQCALDEAEHILALELMEELSPLEKIQTVVEKIQKASEIIQSLSA